MTAWLLTWLWQASALTLAVRAMVRVLPRLNAATRYAIWWVALGATGATGATGAAGALGALGATGALGAAGVSHLLLVPSAPPLFFSILFGVWAAIALVKVTRLLPAIYAVNALRDRCRPFPADVESRLPLWLEARPHGRGTRLAMCDVVPGAAVLGFFDTRIVVPSSLLTSLTADDLDQVILHEYAHVQRRDDWMRLFQALLHALLWIHPAAAFIARQLDREREIACDEWVVARTGLPKAYARCLTRAAEIAARYRAVSNAAAYATLGPTLLRRKKDLLERVERLLAIRGRTRRKTSSLAVLTGACVLLLLATQLRAVPLVGEVGEIGLPALPVIVDRPSSIVDRRLPLIDPPARLDAVNVHAPAKIVDVPPRRLTTVPEGPSPIDGRPPTIDDGRSTIDDPPTLTARPLQPRSPVAAAALASTAPVLSEGTPWRKAASAGVRLGDVFTSAGVSLARRF